MLAYDFSGAIVDAKIVVRGILPIPRKDLLDHSNLLCSTELVLNERTFTIESESDDSDRGELFMMFSIQLI